jgi:RNA polymerase sigma-70 factor (ECF subfamily)
MERYREGDVAAFPILLQRHQGPVFRFLLRHVGDVGTAEDLTQEAFLRVVHRRETFQTGARFTTWLYAIARNLAVDELRRRSYRRHPSLDAPLRSRDGEEGRTLQDVIAQNGRSAEDGAADGEVRTAVEEALAGLPDDQREVFTLREMAGLSFQEIAAVVGCNENTAKSRMRYALERLHVALQPLREGTVEE